MKVDKLFLIMLTLDLAGTLFCMNLVDQGHQIIALLLAGVIGITSGVIFLTILNRKK